MNPRSIKARRRREAGDLALDEISRRYSPADQFCLILCTQPWWASRRGATVALGYFVSSRQGAAALIGPSPVRIDETGRRRPACAERAICEFYPNAAASRKKEIHPAVSVIFCKPLWNVRNMAG
jgi:hypothetical protein